MREQRIDAWLLYDFRGSNPVFGQLFPGKRFTTRRVFLLIGSTGRPKLLVHSIDASQFSSLPVEKETYLSWQEMRGWLSRVLAGRGRVAMEYAAGGALPV